jgi:hypothetical protein
MLEDSDASVDFRWSAQNALDGWPEEMETGLGEDKEILVDSTPLPEVIYNDDGEITAIGRINIFAEAINEDDEE